MKLIRVFPRVTRATPNDENVRFTLPLRKDEADEVHISVAFTYDLKQAEYLYDQWRHVAPVKMGGPAVDKEQGDFIYGLYLKDGYVITSRGCPNKCWFCNVHKKQNEVKELPITVGHIVQDDNLLACSKDHIRKVFEMLKAQPNKVILNGGIEAKRLKAWHVELLSSIRLLGLYCAYDTSDDLEPLIEAGELLKDANITWANRKANCYVLCGYQGDTLQKAQKRMIQTVNAGFFPFSMLYRDKKGERLGEWRSFNRQWSNPSLVAYNIKQLNLPNG